MSESSRKFSSVELTSFCLFPLLFFTFVSLIVFLLFVASIRSGPLSFAFCVGLVVFFCLVFVVLLALSCSGTLPSFIFDFLRPLLLLRAIVYCSTRRTTAAELSSTSSSNKPFKLSLHSG